MLCKDCYDAQDRPVTDTTEVMIKIVFHDSLVTITHIQYCDHVTASDKYGTSG